MKGRDNMIKKEEDTGKEGQVHSAEEASINEPPAPDADLNKTPKEDFPIVGIGASAGGLAAFEAFFSAMPNDTNPGMAFVLVQHLDPNHKSLLTDLIGRYTRMPVYEIKDGMVVQPDCVYVIPPNHDMIFQDGKLQLLEPSEPRGHRLPIDIFFRSLAQSKQELAIGIVLSGTGSDGALGVRAIKAEGGMVMTQTPESSEYDGMPRSAIATNLVDYTLTPVEMPAQLVTYVTQAFGKRPLFDPQDRRRDEKDIQPAAHPDRSRLFPLQAEHHQPPHRAAHGCPEYPECGQVCALFRAKTCRSGGALFRPFNRRHKFLPQSHGIRDTPEKINPGSLHQQAH